MMSEEKLYKLLDELSKRPTTSLALNVMELTEETLENENTTEENTENLPPISSGT